MSNIVIALLLIAICVTVVFALNSAVGYKNHLGTPTFLAWMLFAIAASFNALLQNGIR